MHRLAAVGLGLVLFGSWGNASRAQEAEKPLSPEEMSAFSYVPDDAMALLSARPGQILKHDLVAGFPGVEEALEGLERELRMNPRDVSRVTVGIWHGEGNLLPAQAGPPVDGVFIVQFTKPFDAKAFEAKFPRQEFSDGNYKGIKYRAAGLGAYYMPNPTMFILTQRGNMERVLQQKSQPKPAKIVERAKENGLNHDVTLLVEFESLLPLLKQLTQLAGDLPVDIAGVPDHLQRLSLRLDFRDRVELQLVVETDDEVGAKAIASAYDKGYGLIAQQLPALSRELKDDVGDSLGIEMMKFLNETFSSAKGKAVGKEFRVSVQTPASSKPLMQKFAAFQKERINEIAQKNNLKQIGIAIHNYHDTHNTFPFPAGGSRLPKAQQNKLSWRVHLLPYLGEAELYEKFNLEEAWDSAHNKKLLEEMPEVFKRSPDAKAGHTQYVVPEGRDFIADGEKVYRFRDLTDGPSNTLMVVTVKPEKAEPWTKPGGFALDPEKAAEVLDGTRKGFLGLFADGSVHWLDEKMEVDILKALLTKGGEERIDSSYYLKD